MQHAIQIANYADFGDVHELVALAKDAETAGWDGFFVWDSLNPGQPMVEVMTALTAIASATERIRFGPMVLVLPRHPAWLIAQQAATIDQLSHGRLTMGVGTGDHSEYELLGIDADMRANGQRMDESLAVMNGLWSGEPFAFTGERVSLGEMQVLPKPVQEPRIPVWTAGFWPNRKPFRRAAQWDGIFPYGPDLQRLTPEEVVDVRRYIAEHRTSEAPFDFAIAIRDQSGEALHIPYSDEDFADVERYERAGVTWAMESIYPSVPRDAAREIVAQGPPRR